MVASFFVGRLSAKVDQTQKATVAGGTISPTGTPTNTTPNISMDTIKGLFNMDLVKIGKGDKKLTFVEISDPSCPYCSIASGQNSKLNSSSDQFKLVKDGGTYVAPMEEMMKLVDQGQADFIWIYSNGHGNGEMGAKALYCANDYGKFEQVQDMLYSADGYALMNDTIQNDKSKSQILANFLKSAVPADKMKACLDSGKYDSRLSADMEIAQSLGVQGTPGFYVNAKNFAGAYSFTDMKADVEAALK